MTASAAAPTVPHTSGTEPSSALSRGYHVLPASDRHRFSRAGTSPAGISLGAYGTQIRTSSKVAVVETVTVSGNHSVTTGAPKGCCATADTVRVPAWVTFTKRNPMAPRAVGTEVENRPPSGTAVVVAAPDCAAAVTGGAAPSTATSATA